MDGARFYGETISSPSPPSCITGIPIPGFAHGITRKSRIGHSRDAPQAFKTNDDQGILRIILVARDLPDGGTHGCHY